MLEGSGRSFFFLRLPSFHYSYSHLQTLPTPFVSYSFPVHTAPSVAHPRRLHTHTAGVPVVDSSGRVVGSVSATDARSILGNPFTLSLVGGPVSNLLKAAVRFFCFSDVFVCPMRTPSA
jgi:CBS domain-containing protein